MERDKQKRKKLEAILHPVPRFNNIGILHEHLRKRIRFTAWKGSDRINRKELVYDVEDIFMAGENFYKTYRQDFEWLISEETTGATC